MLPWPLIVVAGLLGSGHCLGMCGPFALAIGTHSASGRSAWLRQLLFAGGRLATYGFLGGVAAGAGLRLSSSTGSLITASGYLAIAAGLFLIAQGLASVGWLHWPSRVRLPEVACVAARAYGSLLSSPHPGPVFLAGLLTGFLPCGLLYGFLALAATTHSILHGAAVMLAFGMGTVPALVATGVGGSLASTLLRARLLRLAAWCVVLTGVVTLARGVSAVAATHSGATEPEATCPFCSQQHADSPAPTRKD